MSALAVGDPEIGEASETFRVRQDASQDRHVEGLPIGTVGGMARAHDAAARRRSTSSSRVLFRTNLGAMRGLDAPHQLEITVDGARVQLATFGGDEDFRASLRNPTLAGDDVDTPGAGAGEAHRRPHTIGVAFIEKPAAQNSWRLQPFVRSSHDTFDPTGYPHLDVFSVTGPYNATGSGDTPSRRRIFVPARAHGRGRSRRARAASCTRLARQAYRGQVSAPTTSPA